MFQPKAFPTTFALIFLRLPVRSMAVFLVEFEHAFPGDLLPTTLADYSVIIVLYHVAGYASCSVILLGALVTGILLSICIIKLMIS